LAATRLGGRVASISAVPGAAEVPRSSTGTGRFTRDHEHHVDSKAGLRSR
jgi:hypothetical protein